LLLSFEERRKVIMLKKRGAGVLLHISSMPSDYGVGVFDENVIHFIDKIAALHIGRFYLLIRLTGLIRLIARPLPLREIIFL